MTTLHDQLGEAVADVRADLPALTVAARSRGLAQRRRRRALAAVGTAAAVVLVATPVALLAREPAATAPVPVAVDPTLSPAPSPSDAPSDTVTPTPQPAPELVPLDGRATAALLAQAIAPYGLTGTSSAGQGGHSRGGYDGTYASVTVAPGTRVEVNVQRASSMPDEPDGITTHREDDDKAGTDRWVAIRRDNAADLRVSVAVVVPEGTTPPLDEAQLAAIAQDPTWALDVPADTAAGAPEPYAPVGESIDGE